MSKSKRFLMAIFVMGLALSSARAAVAEETMEITPRSGVTLRLLVNVPDGADRMVVLFPGGHGKVEVTENGTLKGLGGNFLVRTRSVYADTGLATAVFDAPSDMLSGKGMTYSYRTTDEHAVDIKAAVSALNQKYKLPVWLVGTSRGTVSAANAATRLTGGEIAGTVHTASITKSGKTGELLGFPLDRINVPTLLVHHVKDGCKSTPFPEVRDIPAALTNAPVVELMEIEGGDAGKPKNACGGKSHHGFLGIDRDVAKKIATWIKAH